jgi:hypothetical protein
MQGPVGEGVRQVQEEGFQAMSLDELQGALGVALGESALIHEPRFDHLAVVVEGIGKLIVAAEQALEGVEAAVVGKRGRGGSQVPLAEHTRGVAGGAKNLGQGDLLQGQASGYARCPLRLVQGEPSQRCSQGSTRGHGNLRQTRPDRIATGEKTGPGRRADRGRGVVIRHAYTFRRQTVELGCADAASSVSAQVAIAQIVEEDQHDVGRPTVRAGANRGHVGQIGLLARHPLRVIELLVPPGTQVEPSYTEDRCREEQGRADGCPAQKCAGESAKRLHEALDEIPPLGPPVEASPLPRTS